MGVYIQGFSAFHRSVTPIYELGNSKPIQITNGLSEKYTKGSIQIHTMDAGSIIIMYYAGAYEQYFEVKNNIFKTFEEVLNVLSDSFAEEIIYNLDYVNEKFKEIGINA